jgi:hypothetical protein
MGRDTFRPGELAPESGVYRAVHHAHRMPHDVTAERELRFPECGRCGDRVRFVFIQSAHPVREDYDFRGPEKKSVTGS